MFSGCLVGSSLRMGILQDVPFLYGALLCNMARSWTMWMYFFSWGFLLTMGHSHPYVGEIWDQYYDYIAGLEDRKWLPLNKNRVNSRRYPSPTKDFLQHSISGHWKNSVLSVRSSSPAEYILLCQMSFWGPWWWFSSTLRMAWLEAAVGAPWESRLWWEDDVPIPCGIVASCSVGVGRLVADCDSALFEGPVIPLQVVHFVHLKIIGNIKWYINGRFLDFTWTYKDNLLTRNKDLLQFGFSVWPPEAFIQFFWSELSYQVTTCSLKSTHLWCLDAIVLLYCT